MNLLTRRFPTIVGLFLLIFAIAGGAWFLHSRQVATNPEFAPQKVRISNIADNKFSISWVTTGKTTGEVVYGKVGDAIATVAHDERDGSNSSQYMTHQVTIAGLQPTTQYAFRLVSNGSRYDNNGSPYTVTTGSTIATTPVAKSFYGTVQEPGGGSVTDAIAYLALPGAEVASVLVHAPGSYTIPISTVRTAALDAYISYDPAATVATLTIETGLKTSTATVSLTNATPVPTITMGENPDFRAQGQTPAVAEVQPAVGTPATASASPQTPGIFNVQPLGSTPPTSYSVTLSNPATDGETLATTQPQFRGTGPSAAVLSITVHSVTPYSGTVTVAADGTWAWTPPAGLAAGSHTITINYIDAQGVAQVLERTFTVSKVEAAAGDPAFVASSSAGTTNSLVTSPKPTSTPIIQSTASGRVAMPATGSGVPVTGIIEPTVLTGVIGFAIMVAGSLLLAF